MNGYIANIEPTTPTMELMVYNNEQLIPERNNETYAGVNLSQEVLAYQLGMKIEEVKALNLSFFSDQAALYTGKPKQDGSGGGNQDNKGRGGCNTTKGGRGQGSGSSEGKNQGSGRSRNR